MPPRAFNAATMRRDCRHGNDRVGLAMKDPDRRLADPRRHSGVWIALRNQMMDQQIVGAVR